jgi:hypothetical protein
MQMVQLPRDFVGELRDFVGGPGDAELLEAAAQRIRMRGVAHPGTFVLDQHGVIRARLFLEGIRERHSTEALITAAKAVK